MREAEASSEDQAFPTSSPPIWGHCSVLYIEGLYGRQLASSRVAPVTELCSIASHVLISDTRWQPGRHELLHVTPHSRLWDRSSQDAASTGCPTREGSQELRATARQVGQWSHPGEHNPTVPEQVPHWGAGWGSMQGYQTCVQRWSSARSSQQIKPRIQGQQGTWTGTGIPKTNLKDGSLSSSAAPMQRAGGPHEASHSSSSHSSVPSTLIQGYGCTVSELQWRMGNQVPRSVEEAAEPLGALKALTTTCLFPDFHPVQKVSVS